MTIESSLLYTKEDGTQDFVHDTLDEFFLAKSLAKKVDSGMITPREVYLRLSDGSTMDFFYKKFSTDFSSCQVGRMVKEDETGLNNKNIIFVHPGYMHFFAAKGISESGYLAEKMLPFLVGSSQQGLEFIKILLAENPNPVLLATCYCEFQKREGHTETAASRQHDLSCNDLVTLSTILIEWYEHYSYKRTYKFTRSSEEMKVINALVPLTKKYDCVVNALIERVPYGLASGFIYDILVLAGKINCGYIEFEHGILFDLKKLIKKGKNGAD